LPEDQAREGHDQLAVKPVYALALFDYYARQLDSAALG